MPGDLFAGTFDRNAGPRRSKWTIAGSFVAHTLLLASLLVMPVLSALDSYVVQANSLTFVVPHTVMPAVPVVRPSTSTPAPSDIKNDAAPANPPDHPVTGDATPVAGPPGPPGALPMGPGFTGFAGGNESIVNIPQPPPPAAMKPLPVGGNVKAPTRLSYAEPVYPHLAIVSKTEGMVILEATIDEAGVVRDVRVLRSIALLDQAAMDAVKRWRYTPTRLNGVAVPILLTVTVTFTLR